MRLWSFHPKYLDAKGLVALWREALLAQKVLQGATKGYKNHPQLNRFKVADDPVGAIAAYLRVVVEEADSRGYKFDRGKIAGERCGVSLAVTSGQIVYEFTHLLEKLKVRDQKRYGELKTVKRIATHPLFKEIEGDVEGWEVVHVVGSLLYRPLTS